MSNLRIWVFRGLVIITIFLMVVSWLLPWWSGDIPMLEAEDALIIHPYGLEEDLGNVAAYAAEANMPVWFAPIMWIYLGICIIGLSYGAWRAKANEVVKLGKFKIKLPKLIIGIIGFSYIVVAVIAVIFAAIRTGDYGVKLIGYSYLVENIGMQADLQFGYWMSYGVGLLCIVLALIRGRIIGRPRTGS